MHRIHTSSWHYFILITGLAILTIMFVIFREQIYAEKIIIILLGSFYFGWGMLHHFLNKDWHIKIVLEYFGIAVIGVLILLSLTTRW